ncbi:MAG: branched-chain amino acid ABC transporter permease, partial [Halobacteria archaeon]|nr:branched-chain amino acid ABC transporter permease [Halobacteria archaeon]
MTGLETFFVASVVGDTLNVIQILISILIEGLSKASLYIMIAAGLSIVFGLVG